MAEKACEDGRVFESGDMAECAECGNCVRWDLREHPFWGFASTCPDRAVSIPDSTDVRVESAPFSEAVEISRDDTGYRHISEEKHIWPPRANGERHE